MPLAWGFAAIALLILFVNCAPQKPGPESPAPVETPKIRFHPYDLSVEVSSRRMTVSWKTEGEGLISGYNIYVSTESILGRYPDSMLPAHIQPFNSEPYPGDTNPDDSVEHFVAGDMENGVKYYVSVRVIYPDGRLSRPSNEVAAVCGPRGEIELPVRYSSSNDGFSFDSARYVKADSPDNDVYFYTVDGRDYLASPVRLDGFLRATTFKLVSMPSGLKQDLRRSGQFELPPTADKVEIHAGDWVWIRMPGNTNTLVHALEMTGKDKTRYVKLFYAYCPLAGELIF